MFTLTFPQNKKFNKSGSKISIEKIFWLYVEAEVKANQVFPPLVLSVIVIISHYFHFPPRETMWKPRRLTQWESGS